LERARRLAFFGEIIGIPMIFRGLLKNKAAGLALFA
jgi:hypothetical protein